MTEEKDTEAIHRWMHSINTWLRVGAIILSVGGSSVVAGGWWLIKTTLTNEEEIQDLASEVRSLRAAREQSIVLQTKLEDVLRSLERMDQRASRIEQGVGDLREQVAEVRGRNPRR